MLDIASAGETFAQLTPHTVARCLVSDYELRFAFTTKAFLTGLHRTVTGCDGHGADLYAATALDTKLRPDAEGIVHMAFLAPPYETARLYFPDFCTNPHTAAA